MKYYFYTYKIDEHDYTEHELKYNNGVIDFGSEHYPIYSKYNSYFIVDDFKSNHKSEMSVTVKNAFVRGPLFHDEYEDEYNNIVVVDWGALSGYGSPEDNDVILYIMAEDNVPRVGERLAEFIRVYCDLIESSFGRVRVIGYGLGAHVAGVAGKRLKEWGSVDGDQLDRITGLDPLGLFYETLHNPGETLQPSDAFLVDVYHTSGSVKGALLPEIGSVTMHVNGAFSQPGCPVLNLEDVPAMQCNHEYVVKLFVDAFTTEYDGCPCDTEGTRRSCTCDVVCLPCRDGETRITVGPRLPDEARDDPRLFVKSYDFDQ